MATVTSVAVTGKELSWTMLNIVGSGWFPTAVESGSGRQDKPSAFACAFVGLNAIL